MQLRELEVARRQPTLAPLAAERGRDAVVPPLPGRAAVAVDEPGEPALGEGSEEAEALARDVPRHDLVDAGARRVGPQLGDLAEPRQHLLGFQLADLDLDADRHATASSRPKSELDRT